MIKKVNKYFEMLHPEYDSLSPEEQEKFTRDRTFIEEHLDEIESYYYDCMKEGSGAKFEGRSEQKIIRNAIKSVKADKYFALLHPEYETLTSGEKNRAMRDMSFIGDHIDEIDKYYQGCMREGSGAQQEGVSESEIVKDAIVIAKVEKFYKLAYGDLTPEERFGNNGRWFILEHLDEIESYYYDCMKEGSGAKFEGRSEQKIIINAIKSVKADKYFALLHPEYETLTSGEKNRAMRDMSFIGDHIDEIDKYYQECMREGSGAQKEGLTNQQIIQEAIGNLRGQISVQAIGKSTINTSTTAKKEAERVENVENTRDNKIEGEEVGDDT